MYTTKKRKLITELPLFLGGRCGSNPRHSEPQSKEKTYTYNLKEVRAVTPNYTFSMRRPKKGWNADYKSIVNEWNSSVNRKLAYAQKYASSEERLGRVNSVLTHQATRELAKKYGWEYTRRKKY